MNPEALIREALCLPTSAIAYHVSERLVALFPEKAIVQGDNSIFDVDEYARAQLCGVEKKASIYSQIVTEWQGLQEGIEDATRNAWMETEGFSFAYLKELFLSSMMRWIVTPQPGMMGTLMAGQVDVLREQMLSASRLPEPGNDNEHATTPTRQSFMHSVI